ncbi:nuclear transport factor 2 family protein [Micromonospora carbonacea]|uniref:Nuclear transport factor 2 family protein n=1 Tax=Micromonospora carbonacea TaxID=47853 RepID=A0A7H8XKW3_9ACTN|nr:nuclear transport factor 2 family protein [Micromonospora carbonacea]MBB5825843.1 ketosteroid isomerase-like protein [Micromonospora carbonacea]QLD25444.1 nuclear transport factor 2 family protein [Micromonospora carbonacea]
MGIDENKAIVQRYYDHVSRGERAEADALFADDATWWVAGIPEQFPIAGQRSLTEHQAMLREKLAPRLPNGVRTTITGMTAEGDRVAVEMENFARTASGRIYNNRFHLLFEIRDGRIHAVREYLDTLHAEDALLDGWTGRPD